MSINIEPESLEIVVKMAVTLVVCGILGLEREVTGHKAGIRTMIIVGIGACAFVMIGYYMEGDASEVPRIVAGIATGLGFLGAGAIIKEGLNVKGLTTAAAIWVAAAIGASNGAGYYEIALAAFLFTLVTLTILGIMERKLRLKPNSGMLRICLRKDPIAAERLMKHVAGKGVTVRSTELSKKEGRTCIIMELELPRGLSMSKLISELEGREGVDEVEWEELEPLGQSGYNRLFKS